MDENKIEELTAEEGIECSDEQLDAIAGGRVKASADYDDEAVMIKKLIPKADPNRPIYNPDDHTLEEKLAELQEKLSQLGNTVP